MQLRMAENTVGSSWEDNHMISASFHRLPLTCVSPNKMQSYLFIYLFLISLTFKNCQLILNRSEGLWIGIMGIRHAIWEVVLRVTWNGINPASVFGFLWLTQNCVFSVHLGNVSRLELFVSRVRFRWEAVRAHVGKSDHCINLDVSERLRVFSPSLLDDIRVSVFL